MTSTAIATFNEGALHANLKEWYAQPGDEMEVVIDGAVIDIVRGSLLIEIQTGSFGKIRRKLQRLIRTHAVRLVYPIAREKWIVRMDGEVEVGRRKSPKRGSWWHAFSELVYIPQLLAEPGLSLELLLIQEEEVRRYAGRKAWRKRGWRTEERRLLAVLDQLLFAEPNQFLTLLPNELEDPFTTADLAEAIGEPRRLAQKVAYGLRHMDALELAGRRGRAYLYRRSLPQL